MKTISVPSRALEMAARDSSADFLPISGLEPAPMPPVSFSPIWSLFSQTDLFRSCLSVLTTTKSTPPTPASIMRLITLLPAPPTPITLILTTRSVIFSDILLFLLCICSLSRLTRLRLFLLMLPLFYPELRIWSIENPLDWQIINKKMTVRDGLTASSG